MALCGLLPAIAGTLWAQRNGWEWNGRSFFAPGDFSVYLSYIAQVRNGHLLLQNSSTTEHLVPVLNIFWLLIGWFAFGSFPTAQALIGAAIICAAGLFILYRETRRGTRRPPVKRSSL